MIVHAQTAFVAGPQAVAAGSISGTGQTVTVPVSVELAAFAESVAVPPAVVNNWRLRGRDVIVGTLIERFEAADGGGRSLLLHGLGGSGKTSIAAEVARRLSAKGVAVWWVSAVDSASLVSGMHAVGRLVGASDEELQSDSAADAVWRRLNTRHEPWLLVVDNADDPAVFDVAADSVGGAGGWANGWVRPVINHVGFVLVTSRRGGSRAQSGSRLQPVAVEMLNPTDGAQVLFDHTGGRGGSAAAAEALSERLGGLPLALTLAGSYLAQSMDDLWVDADVVSTFQGYHDALDQHRRDVLTPGTTEDADGVGPMVDRVWEMAVQLLQSRGLSVAGPFMRLLAQFAASPLPYREILRQHTLRDSPVFEDLDRKQAGLLLQESSNLGLINLATATSLDSAGADVSVLHLHPLMRDASHRYLDPAFSRDDYLTVAARLLVDAVSDEPDWSPEDHTKWTLWSLFGPHASHLLNTLAEADVDPQLLDRVAHTVDLAARHLFCRGLRSQAQAEYESMLNVCHRILGDEHERTLVARHGIAQILWENGNHAAAQVEFEAILARQRTILGDEHPDTLITRNSIAATMRRRGDYAAAQAELKAILARQRTILGDEHPHTLGTRNNLAATMRDRGDYAAAQAEYEAVIALQRTILGNEHPHTLTARGNLAGVLGDRGDHAAAQAEYEAVIALQRKIFGNEHLDTLIACHQLALVYAATGKYRDADMHMQAALTSMERILGSGHPEVRTARDNLKIIRQNAAAARQSILSHGPGKRKKRKKRR